MKFHLRDLLWLVLVVGLGCGWWVDHQRLAIWQPRAESLKSLVDNIERPHYVEWNGRGASLVNGKIERTD